MMKSRVEARVDSTPQYNARSKRPEERTLEIFGVLKT
jgi:hypothetical protein